jgi:hypothetical protein
MVVAGFGFGYVSEVFRTLASINVPLLVLLSWLIASFFFILVASVRHNNTAGLI